MKIKAVSRFLFLVSRAVLIAIAALLTATLATAQPEQLPQSSQPMAAAPAPTPAPALPPDLGTALSNVDQVAQSTAASLKTMRIDKWKTDSSTKQQAQQNAESLSRNLTAALPGMIQQVRANPGSVAAQFKLYRNLNALYDVLSMMTEAAGAFGPKNDYQTLSNDLTTFDQARLTLATRLENVTAQQDAEITRLRTALQQAKATIAAAPPKKVVVDDNEPAPSKKKAPAKKKSSAATTPSSKPATPPQ
jgi:hypothetical protein